MKHITKKIITILLLVLSLLLTSCSDNPIAKKKKIKKTAEKVMEAIIDEDDKDLLKFFTSDIQDYHRTKTMSEIQQAFDFIDGKVVSYDYQQGGEMETVEDGKIKYYHCYLEFTNVKTDTDSIYTIECTYHYIWDKKPEQEGIAKIIIFKDNDRENQVQIGQNYDITE